MKNYSAAARRMAVAHAEEMKVCAAYLEGCKNANDKQGAKDFTRLVNEHGAAWARYSMMATIKHACNLDVELPMCFYLARVC